MIGKSRPRISFWRGAVGLASFVGLSAMAVRAQAETGSSPAGPAAQQAAPQVAHQVDRVLADELREHAADQQPAPLVNDEVFLRRVYLDLIGRPPKPEEVIRFSLDTAADKRARAVDRLLDDPAYGQNWGNYWRDVVFYRRSEDRALLAAPVMADYLAEQLNENVSWDQIATACITAEGNVREKGETGLIMAQAGRPEETVAEISRILMGIQIQCAQCHDHPTDRWKREQFHQLAAFFPRVAVRPQMNTAGRSFEVVANDQPVFRGGNNNNNRFRGTPEHYMPNLDDPSERGQQMQPVFFVSGESLDFGVKDAVRRERLAEWLTDEQNPWFARAYVNRLWSELVGEGFYEPVDDLGPDRECSAPRTLDCLCQAFVASGHDTKWLFRTIMATEAYQRESRARRSPDQTPFLANCSQRLRGDQLYNSLVTALELPETGETRRGQYGVRFGPATLFNLTFGFDPSERRDEISGSIPQALLLMNSPLISQAVSANRPTGLGRLLREIEDDEELVVELYLRTLARQPNKAELKTSLDYLAEVGNRSEAFEDLLWTLVNSTEFLHRN